MCLFPLSPFCSLQFHRGERQMCFPPHSACLVTVTKIQNCPPKVFHILWWCSLEIYRYSHLSLNNDRQFKSIMVDGGEHDNDDGTKKKKKLVIQPYIILTDCILARVMMVVVIIMTMIMMMLIISVQRIMFWSLFRVYFHISWFTDLIITCKKPSELSLISIWSLSE